MQEEKIVEFEEGILMPSKEKVQSGILPLMAVNQPTKHKVRLVLDFREVNTYISCHMGRETMREWRQTIGAATIVDPKLAYLQLHVTEKLWQYQLVRYKKFTYYYIGVWVERCTKYHGGCAQDCTEAGGDNRASHKLLCR